MNCDNIEEGAKCPITDCQGILEYQEVENCSCHINPPCSACVDQQLECPTCFWSEEEL